MSNVRKGVPVYLPDETQVGTATLLDTDGTVTITIKSSIPLGELIQENLVGLSIVYMSRDAAEEVINKEKN